MIMNLGRIDEINFNISRLQPEASLLKKLNNSAIFYGKLNIQ